MMTAVRQTLTVSPDGRLEVSVPELSPGTVAEVIVLVSTPVAEPMTPQERVAAWDRLRAKSTLTAEQAEAWIREIKDERMAWRFPGDDVQP